MVINMNQLKNKHNYRESDEINDPSSPPPRCVITFVHSPYARANLKSKKGIGVTSIELDLCFIIIFFDAKCSSNPAILLRVGSREFCIQCLCMIFLCIFYHFTRDFALLLELLKIMHRHFFQNLVSTW